MNDERTNHKIIPGKEWVERRDKSYLAETFECVISSKKIRYFDADHEQLEIWGKEITSGPAVSIVLTFWKSVSKN